MFEERLALPTGHLVGDQLMQRLLPLHRTWRRHRTMLLGSNLSLLTCEVYWKSESSTFANQ